MNWTGMRMLRGLRLSAAIAVLCWIAAPAVVWAGTVTESVLYSFSLADGTDPHDAGGLVQASNGDFYGTTIGGGAKGFGTVFQVTTGGTLSTLYSFTDGADGGHPEAGLVQGTDGNFYGTTLDGGTGSGTFFMITPAGALTALHSFDGVTEGSLPYGNLTLGTDGNFYGTLRDSGTGAHGYGAVFVVTPAGALTILHSFAGKAAGEGAIPLAGLVQGSDGNFYGVTGYGGTDNVGTVFSITPGGTLTTLYSFTGAADGEQPEGRLVQGGGGDFYGVTQYGGAAGAGTLFKIAPGAVTPPGSLDTLYGFTGAADGGNPYSGLTLATDGNFYGTTTTGGASGDGTAFELTPAGVFTTLFTFTGANGAGSESGLILGADGAFYGTSVLGGAGDDGAVFRLSLGQNPSSVALTSSANPSAFGQTVTFTATVSSTAGSPTGTVAFTDGGTTIAGCGAVAISGGVAKCAVAPGVGSNTIKASYGGNSFFFSSTSSTLTQVVGKAPTALALSSSANPSTYGQSITFTATLSSAGGTPAGTVAFTNGTVAIPGCGAVALSNSGVASCAAPSLNAGSYTIAASYGGSGNFSTSKGSLTQVVNQAATALALTSSAIHSTYGQSLTFTATVSSVAGTPAGTVAFTNGGTTIAGCGAVALSTGGIATCASPVLNAGNYTIGASYGASGNFAASGGSLLQLVHTAASAVGLTSSVNPSTYGQTVTFTATVSSAAGIPTGTVAFTAGTATIAGCGAVPLASNGTASCASAALNAASYGVVASYSGSVNYSASSSASLTQLVNQAPTALTATPGLLGLTPTLEVELLKLNATLIDTYTNLPVAGQTISFSAGGKVVCTATTGANGVATCSGLAPWLSAVLGLSYEANFVGGTDYLPSAATASLLEL